MIVSENGLGCQKAPPTTASASHSESRGLLGELEEEVSACVAWAGWVVVGRGGWIGNGGTGAEQKG